jgi:hypothetical protein
VPVCTARAGASAEIGEVFDLVMSGRLAWKGALNGTRRFGCLLVDTDEVRRLLQVGTLRTGLTKKEVGKVATGLS